jgi:hypothetical protein
MSTTARKAPSHELLLADLFELNFRIEDLIAKHELTPAQFLAFSEDETVRKTLEAFEQMQTRHQRILARQHQAGSVGYLHQCIMDAPSTIETRRAATALARLTTVMLAPPQRARSASKGDPAQTQQPTTTPNPTNTPTKSATTPTTLTPAVSSTNKPTTSLEAPLPTSALVITTPARTPHTASTRSPPRASG